MPLRALAALVFLALAGCAQFEAVRPAAMSSAVVPVVARIASMPVTAAMSPDEYRYGRFIVKREQDGQQTVGGFQFLPPDEPARDYRARSLAREQQPRHLVLVDFFSKELHYYVWDARSERWLPNLGFAIITPSPESLPSEVVVGRVRAVTPNQTFQIDWGEAVPVTARVWREDTAALKGRFDEVRGDKVLFLGTTLGQLINRMRGEERPISAAVSEGIMVIYHQRSRHTGYRE